MIRILTATLVAGLIITAWAGTTIDPSRTLYTGRAMGLGGTYLGFANDAEGIFANPSGLTKLEYPQMVGVSRKIFLDETTYQVMAWSAPTHYGTFGMGYVGTAIGESFPTLREPGTNRIVINPSSEAMGYDNSVLMFTYARQLPWYNLSLGGNLKFFNQSIGGGGVGDRASAMNLDLSATYRPLKYLSLGANLQNVLGGSVSWAGTGNTDTLGGYWKLGGALKLFGASTSEALLTNNMVREMSVGLDLDLPQNILAGASLFHLGIEYLPLNFMALRAGLNQDNGGSGMTFGVGFRQSAFRFDYAFAARPGITGDNPHYFSLSYVGDRTVSVSKKFKHMASGINFIRPRDRSLTSLETVTVVAEVKAKKIYDQKTTWTVPLFESTSEVRETFDLIDLAGIRHNSYPINQVGTVEVPNPLNIGRNLVSFSGYTPQESIVVSAEARILRVLPFKDTPMQHWAIEPITLNSVLGLIKGYPDNTFKPEKGITRAELTALLVRTAGIDAVRWDKAETEMKFKDVKEKLWFSPYVNLGVEMGLVTGYPDGTFQPNKVLNRAEGVTILARFAKLPESDGAVFPDLKSGFWANKFIKPAKEAGLLKYLSGKDFNPTYPFAREEAAEVLYQTDPIQRKVNEFWETGMVTEAGGTSPATSESR